MLNLSIKASRHRSSLAYGTGSEIESLFLQSKSKNIKNIMEFKPFSRQEL